VQNQDTQFVRPWIQQHSANGKSPLAKPVIIKEFGVQVGAQAGAGALCSLYAHSWWGHPPVR
jgi:hypothetical protein